jgi:hypothetical protein
VCFGGGDGGGVGGENGNRIWLQHGLTFSRQLLPKAADYSHGPEVGDSLKALLVRALGSTNSRLSAMAGSLLLAVCNNNSMSCIADFSCSFRPSTPATRLVKATGFGNAAGLLASLGQLADFAATGEAVQPSGAERCGRVCLQQLIYQRALPPPPPPSAIRSWTARCQPRWIR